MNFSEKIKQYRKTNGLTQEQLAKKLMISRQAVSKWEQGRGYPDIKTIEALSNLIGISIDELLSNKETKALTVGSANKLNKTIKGLFITICAVSLLLIAAISTILSISRPNSPINTQPDAQSNHQSNNMPKLEGLIGFYIDVSKFDGTFSLQYPNGKDIYLYKLAGAQDGFAKNGVFNDTLNITQYTDSTSYLLADCTIFIDSVVADDYVIYKVFEDENGDIFAKKYEEINHSSADSNWFSFKDEAYDGNQKIGRTFNLTLDYLNVVNEFKIVQYSDKEGQNIITEQSTKSYESFDVKIEALLLDETERIDILRTRKINGIKTEETWININFYTPYMISFYIFSFNGYGYAYKSTKYTIKIGDL